MKIASSGYVFILIPEFIASLNNTTSEELMNSIYLNTAQTL
ncbi:Uncharacterised protein [Sphingobacterium spiritivorum]|nr:Uncharacterised protein [Sphingobacterium spiritivorum]